VDSTYDGTRFVARDRFNNAKVYDWRAGAWALDGQFSMGFANYNGANLAISRDGAIVAGGDFDDTRTDTGVLYPGFQPQGSVHSGAVYVFERKSVGWRERRIVKPALQAEQAYGTVVALGDRGRVLAVGSFGDASAAVGIGGDPTDQSAPERGAAWLY
jgi:hypothetical protein